MNDVMINVKYSTFATAILWENINNDTLTLRVKCYKRYIRALADPICNRLDYTTRVEVLGAVARDGLNTPVPSDYTKESHHAFMTPLLGTNPSWWRH